MARSLIVTLAALAATLAVAAPAQAGGGDYAFDGGTARERGQVRAALQASSFDWGLVPVRVTIHIARGTGSFSRPGHIWLDADLLGTGRFAWAVVQDEYAHQVDFFLLDADMRSRLTADLGAAAWCYGVPGLRHDQYGCERFASTLVWAYWPSKHNVYRPRSSRDESAAMAPARFRALMADLLAPAATR